MGALHMNLNPENSLISFIQCHLWEGMCKQAEYCLVGTCGVCSFSGRKSFPRASFTWLCAHCGPSSPELWQPQTPCPLHSHCHFSDEEIKAQKH